MLDVRRLRVLLEVARQGSFSAAANSLGYTQPAISRQIATLEAEVGLILVRRVPQGVVLTGAGRLLVDRAEGIFARLTDAELELRALQGLEGGTLRLASFASAAAAILPLAVAEFRHRYPAIELDVRMADPVDSLPLLRGGELDLALSHDFLASDPGSESGLAVERAGDIEMIHLFDDPMYVAMRADHPLADVGPLELARFAEDPWMLATTDTCPDSRLFLRACYAAGFEPRIAFQNDDYQAILGFVAAGVGVALIPDMVARGVRDDVVVRDLDPPAPARPILAVLPSGYRSPAAAAMLDILREVSERWVDRRTVPVEISAR
jgi:DNA-binding transcriptional LysR family regulator